MIIISGLIFFSMRPRQIRVLAKTEDSGRIVVFFIVLIATIGSLLGGALGTAFGLHATLWITGLATLAGSTFLYLSPFRTLRTVPAQSEAI